MFSGKNGRGFPHQTYKSCVLPLFKYIDDKYIDDKYIDDDGPVLKKIIRIPVKLTKIRIKVKNDSF